MREKKSARRVVAFLDSDSKKEKKGSDGGESHQDAQSMRSFTTGILKKTTLDQRAGHLLTQPDDIPSSQQSELDTSSDLSEVLGKKPNEGQIIVE